MDYTKCNSASDFENKFRSLLPKLEVAEKEETWQQLDTAIRNMTSLVKAGATTYDTFVPMVRRVADQINKVVASERTRLNGSGLALIEEMARRLETRFGPICELVFPTALKSCGRANRVFVTRGMNCLSAVITHAHAADQTPHICRIMTGDLNKSFRASAARLLMNMVSSCTAPELSPYMAVVEEAIAKGVVDAHPDARTITKRTYEAYIRRFGSRKDTLHGLFDSTAKKYLKIEDSSNSGGNSNKPMSRFAAFRQRPPLHNRLAPQRPNGHAVGNGGLAENAMSNSTGARPPAAHQRLRPVRPVARHGSATMYRPTPPMAMSGSATGSLVRPGSASAPCSIEPLHLSSGNTNAVAAGKPCSEGNSPTATVFESIVAAAAVEPKSNSSAPITSQHASRENSPTFLTDQPIETVAVEDIVALATGAEAPVVQKKASSTNLSTSGQTTPAERSDDSVSKSVDVNISIAEAPKAAASRVAATEADRRASRAQRMQGLSFSSLKNSTSSSGPRTPHAVRPATRNIVTSRVEEALRGRPRARPRAKPTENAAPTARARRPVRAAAKPADKLPTESPSRRMTLRSDTKIEPLVSLDDHGAKASGEVPGYLRATAASAHRTAELADEQRTTRRRKREGSLEPSAEEPAAKTAKTDVSAVANI